MGPAAEGKAGDATAIPWELLISLAVEFIRRWLENRLPQPA